MFVYNLGFWIWLFNFSCVHLFSFTCYVCQKVSRDLFFFKDTHTRDAWVFWQFDIFIVRESCFECCLMVWYLNNTAQNSLASSRSWLHFVFQKIITVGKPADKVRLCEKIDTICIFVIYCIASWPMYRDAYCIVKSLPSPTPSLQFSGTQ